LKSGLFLLRNTIGPEMLKSRSKKSPESILRV
jgi:hypothetical protein